MREKLKWDVTRCREASPPSRGAGRQDHDHRTADGNRGGDQQFQGKRNGRDGGNKGFSNNRRQESFQKNYKPK